MSRSLHRWLAGTMASCGALALVAAAGSARAEDIDIYSANVGGTDRPNVLIVLDNSANWQSTLVHNCKYKESGVLTADGPAETSAKVGLEKCALHNVIDALPTGPTGEALYNVGLMMFSSSGAKVDGGYPRIALVPVTATEKANMKARIRAIEHPADKSDGAAFAKALHEAYLYYAGAAPYAGDQLKPGDMWRVDMRAFSSGKYLSPAAASCSRNYVIFIGNGSPGDPTAGTKPESLLAGLGGDTTELTYPAGYIKKSDQANYADEYTKFMASADLSTKEGAQMITTYTVGVTDGAKTDVDYLNFLRAMAQQGGGDFHEARSADQLTTALLDIFQELADVDSAFVSASLPVSVNSRGTYLNQIFMGLFRPDATAAPRWRGNLKQYQFAYDAVTDSLQLADSAGNPAINPATGFFAPSAVSFWTTDSTFWASEQMGTPPSASDAPDGQVVEKGGAAQRLREAYATSTTGPNRRVYTCTACAANSALGSATGTVFGDGNASITQADLGVGSAADRTALIEWVRGNDNKTGDELGASSARWIRPSVHGDVLHSRPVVVNYGGSKGVVVFYGANDGMLHAVNGNQAAAGPDGTVAGGEYWSFVPTEGFDKLKRLRDNDPKIRLSTTPLGGDFKPRDYFFDGPLSFYQKIDANGDTEKVYLYAAMRRGGRALYSFDVTDPTAPKFRWKKDFNDIAVLGQTWSEARVAKVKGYSNPVLVMGAGYDAAAEDVEPQGAVTMGNAVLVLDAETGVLLANFPTTRPVVADVALVDTDYDGLVDRGYAADLGGNVYRIDFEAGTSSGTGVWAMKTFANLGARKIFYAPDVVVTKNYAVVLVGTGDREKPLDKTTDERFFSLFDDNPAKGLPAGFTPISISNVVPQSSFTTPSAVRGCYVALDPAGEKVVNSPVTAGGVTYFSTNRPSSSTGNSCTGNLGEAKVYGVPLMCKTPKSQVLLGGGLPPSPVTGNVAVTYVKPDGTTGTRLVPFIIGGFNTKKSGIEGSKVPVTVPPKRKRLYWYPETER